MTAWPMARHAILGALTLGLGLGGFTLWAVATEINGAVIAPGRVEVEARRQTLQHPDGGVVAEILVRDGDSVAAGAPLLVLDGTELRAQQALLTRNLWETLARTDRLRAEVRGDAAPAWRPELLLAAAGPEIARVLEDEAMLFASRAATLGQMLAQLDERLVQTGAVIDGHQRQIEAGATQLSLIHGELADQQSLLDRGLTQAARVSALRREEAELSGEIGRLQAAIAEARSAQAGDRIEKLRLAAARREEAQDQLRQLAPQETELRETLRVVDSRLGRLVLRAPMAGRVLDLRAHTVGGVIAPTGDVVSIVPEDTPRILAVRIDPRQIDRLQLGQPALMRFPNFDSRTTPDLFATLRTVAADTVTDPVTHQPYYTAELTLTEDSRRRIDTAALQPGMPIEAFIQTGLRTPASFLLKPLTDYAAYALRDR
ncbi:HlyD family type I secretion periplasmic adaptor subunit [Frigidibacter sp. MR17.24]|uniref:HlyD family type I secretion periplasmic adaptor subunit n=1 Tax=Frigidibacter sp. MR17.24 TaxID=3127345 RepID=UPI003012AFA7